MPEGPSILILKEQVQSFKGKKILKISGNTKTNKHLLVNKTITDFKSWGKHFLICTPKINVRIHFMLFGSYSINEQTKANPRLGLKFKNGSLYFYACSVKMIDEDLNDVYDWSADVLNDSWNATAARKKLNSKPETLVCDALLDQQIFSGVGNIIKNEVLYRIKMHPESLLGKLPSRKLR
ncbi:MAG: DNA-formamidopyrimidine glycosylase family protein, partial [Parafilimonas sp.]